MPENENGSLENFSDYFCHLKKSSSVLVKIPKTALNHVAGTLDTLLRNACQLPATGAWEKLICFPYWGLRQPDKSPQNRPDLTLTTKIKNQVDEYMACTGLPELSPRDSSHVRRQSTNQEDALRRRVNIKFMEGDIRGAVREVCSSNGLAPFSPETLTALQEKHPPAPANLNLPLPPEEGIHQPRTASRRDISKAINSFKPGSAAGPDGLRPGHLKQLVCKSVGETGNRLLGTLTVFVNLVLSGNVPEHITDTFYGANLCALNKDGGGIRPIAVGNTLRRLATKVGQRPIAHGLGNHFRPTQLGFETKGGCEAAVHAARQYLNGATH